MSDEFDKQPPNDDDDFDWLDEGDEEGYKPNSSGLTGQLSWIQSNDDDLPDSQKKNRETDELNLDWMKDAGEKDVKGSRTGITGELSWLQSDEDSPDAHAHDDIPDWLKDSAPVDADMEDDEEEAEPSAPANKPRGLLSSLGSSDEDEDELEDASADSAPSWLSNMGDTGALTDPDAPASAPDWLASVGDTGRLGGSDADDDDAADYDADYEDYEDDDYEDVAEDEGGDWLSGMGIGANADSEPTAVRNADIPEWLRDVSSDQEEPAMQADDDMSEWMDEEEDAEFAEEEEDLFTAPQKVNTDYLTSQGGIFDAEQPVSKSADESVPDWLQYDESADEDYEDAYADDEELDDLFTDAPAKVNTDFLTEQGGIFGAEKPTSDALPQDTPDWLSQYGDDDFAAVAKPEIESNIDVDPLDETPDWLKSSFEDEQAETTNFDFMHDVDIEDDGEEVSFEQDDFIMGFTEDEELFPEDLDEDFIAEIMDEDQPQMAGSGMTGELLSGLDFDDDINFLDEIDFDESEEPASNWFGEDEEIEENPDWMQTLEDADVDDLLGDVEDISADDLLAGLDFDDDLFEAVDDPIAGQSFSDLDTLLASFEDVDDDDFVMQEDDDSDTDFGALFDSAMAPAPRSHDDLPENIPDWLREVNFSDDETSAAAIIRKQSDRPLEDLDDRLSALRNKGLSVGANVDDALASDAPSILAGMGSTLRPAEIHHETAAIAREIALTDNQRRTAALLSEIVGVTVSQSTEIGESGEPIVQSSRHRARGLPNVGRSRLLVAVVLLIAVIVPFVTRTQVGLLPPANFSNPSALAVFEHIDSVPEGSWVLIGVEYGPTGAGELDTLTDVLLRHVFAKGAKPVIVSSNPIGLIHARNILDGIAESVQSSGLTVLPNQDYYVIRYLAGGTVGLRDLSQNIFSVTQFNRQGTATGLNIHSLDEFALMIVIGERSEEIRAWAEQVAPLTHTRLLAAIGYAAQPLTEPYVNSSQGIAGLLVGYRDAYTYASMLANSFNTPVPLSLPSETPTEILPTATPTLEPTDIPTDIPTEIPSDIPTEASGSDSGDGQVIVITAGVNTQATAVIPTNTPVPSATPSLVPTIAPSATNTALPSSTPTNTPSATPTPKLIRVLTVTEAGSVNVRQGPGTNFNLVGTANNGDVFLVIGENDDASWIQFQFPDGTEAWIAAFLVEITELPEDELQSDDSADAGSDVVVMKARYDLRLGKNNSRTIHRQSATEIPIVDGTLETFTPTMTFTPSVTPTATLTSTPTLTPTATPDPRINFVPAQNTSDDESRLTSITVGTIAAIVIILLGNLFYGLRAIIRRRRDTRQ